MKTIQLLVVAGTLSLAGSAAAQVEVRVNLPLPVIRFEARPPLVVVSPGIQVVPDYDDEVFFVDGWYWTRNEHGWYRTRTHSGGWVVVEPRHVPPGLTRHPPGHYRHYRAHRVEPARYPQPVHQAVPVHEGGHGKGHGKDKHEEKHGDRH